MADETVAVVENVGKCYHIYRRNIDRLTQSLALGRRKLYHEFWALRDVSFTVRRGETVGIIGANGSGKSTLLQLLFGVLRPTTGRLHVKGRVGGLLELGAGFNPEETGRENILINAAILGIPPGEVKSLCARVAEFADIGEFLDQPIKLYSSGMSVRLGFALQISIPSDVLIIDEALAVGDELFQRRCFAALEKFRRDGGTILFVSHSAASVTQLCEKAIFLDHGRMIQCGPARTVVDHYQKFLYMPEPRRSEYRAELLRRTNEGSTADSTDRSTVSQTASPVTVDYGPVTEAFEPGLIPQSTVNYAENGATIEGCRIETPAGRPVNVLLAGRRYRFRYDVQFREDCSNVLFGAMIKSTTGLELGGTAHASAADAIERVAAGSRLRVSFEFNASLLPGVYYFNCGVNGSSGSHQGFLARIVDAVAFRIAAQSSRQVAGFVDFRFDPTVEEESADREVAGDVPQTEAIG